MNIKVFLLLLALAILLGACGQAPVETEGFTFTDDLGRTISLDAPERVAVLTGSFADIWCLAGGRETLVAAAGENDHDGLILRHGGGQTFGVGQGVGGFHGGDDTLGAGQIL